MRRSAFIPDPDCHELPTHSGPLLLVLERHCITLHIVAITGSKGHHRCYRCGWCRVVSPYPLCVVHTCACATIILVMVPTAPGPPMWLYKL